MKRRFFLITLAKALALTACAPFIPGTFFQMGAQNTAEPYVTLPTLEKLSSDCRPVAITKPTPPAVIPGNLQLDESTGLHMTGTVKNIDLASYRLEIKGKVDHPMSLTLDQLRCLPKITAKTTLTCKGNFEDYPTFSGVPLKVILNLVGVQMGAKAVNLIGADGYASYLPLIDAFRPDNFLAYEWNGEALPIFHGFPLRAVIPSQFGAKWAKWLVEMTVE
jgi:DMSO/TMAO reductase YedYZ molybdopterin-dependent catalytic subunit